MKTYDNQIVFIDMPRNETKQDQVVEALTSELAVRQSGKLKAKTFFNTNTPKGYS